MASPILCFILLYFKRQVKDLKRNNFCFQFPSDPTKTFSGTSNSNSSSSNINNDNNKSGNNDNIDNNKIDVELEVTQIRFISST